jgi:hypothetical protein
MWLRVCNSAALAVVVYLNSCDHWQCSIDLTQYRTAVFLLTTHLHQQVCLQATFDRLL